MDKGTLKQEAKISVAAEVAKKVSSADSVLIALSNNPSVDELATAIGLSMIIDKMGKRVTAIYSGQTPNVLSFLKPDEAFDKDVVGLQDFVIAINKDKADHLRYKLDGDFVKVFITPYRSPISTQDLEFSYGEFNVDLVIALNVDSAEHLDNALLEYGRILHDASIVNITTLNGNKFGEIVWCEEGVSSLAELVVELAELLADKFQMDADIATALLTGIVAKTERFSNELTNSRVMTCAGKLMSFGANQQLISSQMMEMMVSNNNVQNGQNFVQPVVDNSQMSVQHEVAQVVEEAKNQEPKTSPEVLNIMSGIKDRLNNSPSVQGPEQGIAQVDVGQVINNSVSETMLGSQKKVLNPPTEIKPDLASMFLGSNPALTQKSDDMSAPDVPHLSFDNTVTERQEPLPPQEAYLKNADAQLNPIKGLMDSQVVVQPIVQDAGASNTGAQTNGANEAVVNNVLTAAQAGTPVPPSMPTVLPMPGGAGMPKPPTPPPLSL